MTHPPIDTQEALDRFVEAVQSGHQLFAHPDTIQQLSEIPAAREFAARFEPCHHLEPGDMIAVDSAIWTFRQNIPLATVSYPNDTPGVNP